jgi:hypothetical protein
MDEAKREARMKNGGGPNGNINSRRWSKESSKEKDTK